MTLYIWTRPDGGVSMTTLMPDRFNRETGGLMGLTQEQRLRKTLFECSRERVPYEAHPSGWRHRSPNDRWNPALHTFEALAIGIADHWPITYRAIEVSDLPISRAGRNRWYDTGTEILVRA